MQPDQMVSSHFEIMFLSMQSVVVAFLLLHDWVPLGRLNNVAAMRGEDSVQHRLLVTLFPLVPAAVGLYYCYEFFGQPYPQWLETLLWITYGVFMIGLLRAWWVPYLVIQDPARAARYRIIFAGTYKFLPERNGMAPDTLHTLFHLAVVATLIALFL